MKQKQQNIDHKNVNVNLMVENWTSSWIKSEITIYVGVSLKIKNIYFVFEKGYIWNSTTCSCENGKYLGSIIDDSVITCYQIIEDTKTVPTKTARAKTVSANLLKKVIFEIKNFYILLTFSLTR